MNSRKQKHLYKVDFLPESLKHILLDVFAASNFAAVQFELIVYHSQPRILGGFLATSFITIVHLRGKIVLKNVKAACSDKKHCMTVRHNPIVSSNDLCLFRIEELNCWSSILTVYIDQFETHIYPHRGWNKTYRYAACKNFHCLHKRIFGATKQRAP